jgi:hypothetical protein
MSSSALGPLTAPSAQKGRAAGGSSRRASARSSRGPLTARRPIRVRRPAVRRGACGPEPAMRSRRWRSGSVGPPDPGRGCPELVKPILLTDKGVCMLQQALRVGPPTRHSESARCTPSRPQRQRSLSNGTRRNSQRMASGPAPDPEGPAGIEARHRSRPGPQPRAPEAGSGAPPSGAPGGKPATGWSTTPPPPHGAGPPSPPPPRVPSGLA